MAAHPHPHAAPADPKSWDGFPLALHHVEIPISTKHGRFSSSISCLGIPSTSTEVAQPPNPRQQQKKRKFLGLNPRRCRVWVTGAL